MLLITCFYAFKANTAVITRLTRNIRVYYFT